MVTVLVVLVVLGGSGAAGWAWWQGRVTQAAGQQLQDAAALQAALALSDPKDGGTLAWEAGRPAYHPVPEASEQERALLRAWEMTLREVLEPASGQKPLPLQIDEYLPAMLPVSNAALYTARPRTLREAQNNMRALAATSVLMQRRAQRWYQLHGEAAQALARELMQEQTLEQVNLAQWRQKVLPPLQQAAAPEPQSSPADSSEPQPAHV